MKLVMQKKKIALYIGIPITLIVGIEIIGRLTGLQTYKEEFSNLEMSPEWMYENDSILGTKLKPGIYAIIEENEYEYKATIHSGGYRINPALDSITPKNSPQIIFLGAGSTFGQGLSDEQAYPFVLQKMAPQYRVRIDAVMGYGVSNNYARIKHSTDYKPGDIIIYIYHSDQDNRFRLANQKRIYGTFSKHPQFKDFHYLKINEKLETSYQKYSYSIWPLSKYSVISNYLEDKYNNYQDSKENSNEIARKAIIEMNSMCKEKGITFNVVCWKSDNLSLETIDYLKNQGINTYHIPYVIGFGHLPKEELAPSNYAFADSLVRVLHLNQ